ncbi:MAG: hypothetical protein H8E61_09950 [Bacteroidetes bacterium]|nr:hypothetical protein [Bacteroidota bacterium]
MKEVEILNQIQLTLDQINVLIDQMKTQSGRVKSIEIDLLKSKIVQLYDQLQNLPPILTEEIKTEDVAVEIVEDEREEIEIEEKSAIMDEADDQSIEKKKESVEEVALDHPENKKEIIEESAVETSKDEITPKTGHEEFKEEINAEEFKEEISEKKDLQLEFKPDIFDEAQQQIKKKSVHEKFTRTEPSVNEKIASSKVQSSVGDSLQKGPITDFKSAISLNLKLSLIKDLYQGDQKEYRKMIDFLSKCKNYSEAKMYLTNEKENRKHWTDKPELVENLMDLITRRFRMD